MTKDNFLSLKTGDVIWAYGVTYEVVSAEGENRTLRSGQIPHQEITLTPEHFLVPSLLLWRRVANIPGYSGHGGEMSGV
jgi:hypothetical protein